MTIFAGCRERFWNLLERKTMIDTSNQAEINTNLMWGRLLAARHVGCTTCGGEWYHPHYGTPHCSGGNLPPSGPQGRNRGTFVFVSSNLKAFVVVWGGFIQQNGLYSPRCQPLAGAGWRWVNAATLFRIWGNTIHRHRLLLPPLRTLTDGYK